MRRSIHNFQFTIFNEFSIFNFQIAAGARMKIVNCELKIGVTGGND